MKYDLENRLITFAIDIIKLFDHATTSSYSKIHLSKQLIRSSTAVALNYGEAQSAESTKDYLHKMRLSLKELRESHVNLRIQKGAGLISSPVEQIDL
jgi:four helix bundle protein